MLRSRSIGLSLDISVIDTTVSMSSTLVVLRVFYYVKVYCRLIFCL